MNNRIEYKHDDANKSMGFLLWKLHMLWQRKIKEKLDTLGITHTQFVLLSVLAWLSRSQNIVTQTDIATHSKTDRMMVSKVLRTLEGKRFIARLDNKEDTRIKMISLTREGERILQQAIIVVEQVDADFFSPFNCDLELLAKDFNCIIEENG